MRVRLLLLCASVASLSGGLAWWVHPGLGIAVAGACGASGALFYDDGRPQK